MKSLVKLVKSTVSGAVAGEVNFVAAGDNFNARQADKVATVKCCIAIAKLVNWERGRLLY